MNIPLNEWNGSKEVRQALEDIQRQNASTQRWMLIVGVIAAIGGSIAAWPVVKEWLVALKVLAG